MAFFASLFEGLISGCEKYACFCFFHVHVFGSLSTGGGVLFLRHKGDIFLQLLIVSRAVKAHCDMS